ncbi:hypothetical protein Nepgr_002617 [Nepenthes gracilis]|uniref:Uncharacterized protein n=1 Tax=Nepenthes gracilis TaxID=150966 RepID=A0AAD3P7A6_NEPGR|nr:hypothetical protein Nepgr_002617 [Nepenthes gracilis]
MLKRLLASAIPVAASGIGQQLSASSSQAVIHSKRIPPAKRPHLCTTAKQLASKTTPRNSRPEIGSSRNSSEQKAHHGQKQDPRIQQQISAVECQSGRDLHSCQSRVPQANLA